MGIVRKQTYLTEEQNRAIKRLVDAAGMSQSDILRQAVDAYLVARGMGEARDPCLAGEPGKQRHG